MINKLVQHVKDFRDLQANRPNVSLDDPAYDEYSAKYNETLNNISDTFNQLTGSTTTSHSIGSYNKDLHMSPIDYIEEMAKDKKIW